MPFDVLSSLGWTICNSLLGGISCTSVLRLQRLHNRAVRLIHCVDRYLTAILRELIWLPVQQRVDFKSLLHVYNCINATAPSYIRNLLTTHEPGRVLA
ncbi:hypothetical protein HOLleu_27986 [Holothuria leucospilota]|uniref:Uncharacterized protein n=1 Tax=Holothuria leucospilota TaxID=206669 RepID=A0A9Q1BR87_HOLLE|nr:hypothetical protein HOLleu_27986 [Holothuria leucospilota]